MITLLSALFFFTTSDTKASRTGAEFFLRTNTKVPIERLAAAVKPLGRIESRKRGSSLFLIQLKPGYSEASAKKRLAAMPGVHLLNTREEQYELQAVRELNDPLKDFGGEEKGENLPSGGVVAIRHGSSMEFRRVASGSKQTLRNDQMPGTDGPGEAARWRRLALVDEHGVIPPNALQRAIKQKQALAASPSTKTQSQTWTELGPSNFSGRSRCVVIDPTNPQRMWIGAVGGGIWRSLDGGQSWTPVGDKLPSIAVTCMTMDPNDNKTLYAGTGEGYFNGDGLAGQGVYKSTDGGTTWSQLAGTAGWTWSHVNRIAVCPGNSNLILITQQYGGIFRSTDGGKTFSNPFWAQSGHAVAFSKVNPNRVIGTIQDYNFSTGSWYAAAIYSTDAGASWTKASGPLNNIGGFSRVETCPDANNEMLAFASASDGNVYKSTDGGQSYAKVNTNGTTSANWYANCIWIDPTNSNRLVITGTYVYGSTDGGATITRIGAGYIQTDQPHPDDHTIVAAPGYDGVNNKTIYICSDGGLYATLDITTASTNGGWFRLDQGARTTQYYSVAGDGPANFYVGGLQDNGSEANQLGNGTAYCFFGGDGGYVAIDPTNSQFVYGEYIDLEIFRNNDGATGGNSGWIYGGIGDAGNNANFIAPFILDPNNPLTLLAGGGSLWRTTNARDGAPAWTAIRPQGSSLLSAIAVANGNSDIIWVGQNDGGIAMTTNGTADSPTWKTISTPAAGPIPGRYVTRILIDPDQPNTVYVTLGGFTSNNVWKTTNAGATWVALNGSGNGVLPQVPVRAIARRPAAPNTLYVGTEIGVFSTTDGGNTWTTSSDMGINVSVDDLQYMNNSATLLAATHGRGIWSLPYGPGVPQSLSIAPSTVLGGASSTATVTLNSPAGTGGAVITLGSSNAAASIPASVIVPEGSTFVTAAITTLGVSSLTTANITATMGPISKTAPLSITPAVLSLFTLSPNSVVGGASATGTVTLKGIAPPNGAVIALTANSTSVTVPSSVIVPGGATTATFPIGSNPVVASVNATISATLASSTVTASITVTPPALSTFDVSPSTVPGGVSSTGTVTLTGSAPAGGLIITLTSSSSKAIVPSAITVPAGASSVTFTVTTTGVPQTTSVTLFAGLGGNAKSATLVITPTTLSTVSISPSTVTGGTSATGSVTLNGPAPTGGIVVNLSSSTVSATVPPTILVPSGSTSATFTIATSSVTSTLTATITGALNGNSASGSFTILTPLLSTVSTNPTAVVGGNSVIGTVTLARVAPTGGALISLSSSGGASVPTSVVVAAGSISANFTITTSGESSAVTVIISASLSGTAKTANLTVNPAGLIGLTVTPNVVAGGNSPTGTVTLNGSAPSGGATISLASTSTSASVPTTVVVAPGTSTAIFPISTTAVGSPVNAVISASLSGTSLTASLTIQPAALTTFTLNPTTVVGGSDSVVQGIVSLTGFAPTSGATVTLASSNTAVATVPASVKILSGTTSISFKVSHKLVSSAKSVTITASYAGVKLTANLNLISFQVASLSFAPTSVIGGNKSSGTVMLNAQPGSSGPITVKLTSSAKSLTVPATVSLPVGQIGAVFNANTSAVSALTTATATVTYGTSSQQATVMISPASLIAVSVSPSTVTGSASTAVTGTVSLNGLAPTGGLVVTLTSSNAAAAKIPATVTIPAGKGTATFKVTHSKVTSQTSVTITASLAGVTQTTKLTVTP